ncbi:hypothetical protein [Alkalicoccus luteus]|uniref:hypothetical protein n=1 Tax=Alkalicoccus luteus TaxID=1237094 RepID=UPI0040345516
MNQQLLKLTIFLSSCSPIFYIASLRLYEDQNLSVTTLLILFGVVTVIAVSSITHAYHGLYKQDDNTTRPEATSRVSSVQPLKNSLFTAYLVSFFLPIIDVSFASITDTVTFLTIFALLFILSLQTNMYYFNAAADYV